MNTSFDIAAALQDPKRLEQLYQRALRAGSGAAFAAEIARLHTQAPDNALLAAWYYRLHQEAASGQGQSARSLRLWQLAVLLGLLVGLVYWLLARQPLTLPFGTPYLLLLWAPLAACALIAYLAAGAAGAKPLSRAVVIIAALLLLALYAVWQAQSSIQAYHLLMAIHLALLAWIGVGLLVAGPGSDDRNRFAFLLKSTEAVVTGGIYGGATMLFMSITIGLFDAIGIQISDDVGKLLFSLAGGLIPVLAVATVYDPAFAPIEQRFEEGLPKLIFTLGRVFLPLTLIVGVIYVVSIPSNVMRPFEQRDVLIIYNLMLFAVMGLLVFATPITTAGLSEAMQAWLRRGILAVAALAVLVSLYALSATVYRTWQGGLTMNRLTIIGWNIINIGVLVHLLYRQVRSGQGRWLESTQATARLAMIAYIVWTLFLILAIPWLFG